MTEPVKSPVVLLTGAERTMGEEIVRRLERDGFRVLSVGGDLDPGAASVPVDAVVVNEPGRMRGVGFLDLPDAAFVDGLFGFLDLVATLQAALARLRPGGALVVVVSRAYLGAWGGTDEAAFSAATVGLMRSVALENTPRGVRANVVAADFPPEDLGGGRLSPHDQAVRVAGAVAFLLGEDATGVNGEVILTNAGQSLRRREARDRRADLAV